MAITYFKQFLVKMSPKNRVVFTIAAAMLMAIGLLLMKRSMASADEFLTPEEIAAAGMDHLSRRMDDLSRSLNKLVLDDHNDYRIKAKVNKGIEALNVSPIKEQKGKSGAMTDEVRHRLDELRVSLDRLWCKTVNIGSTGGFCLTEENIDIGGNSLWDVKLCVALEQMFGHAAVVDLGAGLGHYGKCVLRMKEPIFRTKEKKIAHDIHNEYIKMMGELIIEPQVIKSWEGYDGAVNVGYLSKGFIKQQDLSVADLWLGRTWDWVLSLEVGEHVPAPYEDIFIDNLVKHGCKGIVISWGLEGQIGHHHVNGQSNAYIKQKLADRGLVNDIKAENLIRETTVLSWFKNTLMVFRYPEGYKC